jgi:putative peptide zinc metalloprotease protein
MKLNKQTFRTISVLIITLMILFLPWKSSMKIPAVYISEKYSKIYSPYSAKIKSVLITKDQEVVVGQNLIELYSPELDKDINSIRRKILLTKTKINRMSGTSGNMDEYLTYNQRVIKAPNKGKVKDLVSLSNEMWVSNLDQLLGIVHYGTGNVKAFIREEHIDRFQENTPAVFIPNDGDHKKIHLISSKLDLSSVNNLPYIALSSIHSGPIAIRNFTSGEYQYRPETAHYVADFKLVNKSSIKFELPGYVHVEGNRYSPFVKFFRNVFSVLIRESGF